MDFWPPNSPSQSEWQGKNKKTTKVTQSNYPIVAQGAIGAANLVYNDIHLQWTFLTQVSRGKLFFLSFGVPYRFFSGRKVVTQGESTKIFPASRVSSLYTSRLSTRHRAEQGVRRILAYKVLAIYLHVAGTISTHSLSGRGHLV